VTAHFSNHRVSDIALHHLLARVAAELEGLYQDNRRIEELLGKILSQSRGADADAAIHLQGIDRLTQTLDALAQFLGELARGVDPSMTVDPTAAIGKIPLRDLALALAGQMVAEKAFPPHHGAAPAGNVDFF
jgi:hypothetical protein